MKSSCGASVWEWCWIAIWRETEVVRDPLNWADLPRSCVEGLQKASWIVNIVGNEIAIGEEEAIQEKWRQPSNRQGAGLATEASGRTVRKKRTVARGMGIGDKGMKKLKGVQDMQCRLSDLQTRLFPLGVCLVSGHKVGEGATMGGH